MNKLKKIMDSMNYEELLHLKRDYDSGNLKKLIDKKLAIIDVNEGFCPTCYKQIIINQEKYRLIFGPPELRKQAVFDELDCMEHFMNTHIKELKKREKEFFNN